jgi:2-oxo-4-hydroxy-4-carboxy-5-ureidoimidazoline decarboxylase
VSAARALDALDETAARAQLLHCCGARRWVDAMLARRPFGDDAALGRAVDAAFAPLTDADWLEAFAHHPQIGDVDSLRKKFAATSHLTTREQAGVTGASEATLAALAEGNAAYEARYGFIFIVCATGKSAQEMLDILRSRLDNDTARELAVAAGEQRKITQLRLQKLAELAEGDGGRR